MAKLERADESITSLLADIHAFFVEHPEPFAITSQLRNGDRELVFTATGALVVPDRFAVLVGEIFYHLRAALDHVVASLVDAHGGVVSTRHQFPICSTPGKFREAFESGKLEGIPHGVQDQIEMCQPYRPEHPQPRLLELLREWSNSDKHRDLIIVGGATALRRAVRIVEADRAFSIAGMTPPRARVVRPGGNDVFAIYLGESHNKFRAEVDFVPLLVIEDVGDLECATVAEVVTKLASYVRCIVESFKRFVEIS